MICEYCNTNIVVKYGSGRFCSSKCARGYSTKDKRELINIKVSKALTNVSTQKKIQAAIAAKHSYYVRKTEAASLLDMSKRTMIKIIKRMELSCSYCGWYVDGVVGDVHHIVEKKNGGTDSHTNLSYLCPNCHRCVHSGVIDSSDLVTLDEYIGDDWKKYYYVNDIGITELKI